MRIFLIKIAPILNNSLELLNAQKEHKTKERRHIKHNRLESSKKTKEEIIIHQSSLNSSKT